ncbi:aminodeoxychorismate lyase [Vibrio aphrogenes]|uniref:aminodeoxychorismate lyase n=1 Tax=Vibrio aphrogenes TaxID=1891186 RepID=UPI000B35FB6E|nr:aminodeoxychorismate lyase [Vibrio aphrogenes]
MFFVNGHRQEHISLQDRSFHYGDGCFTTILVKEGEPLYLEAHQQRLTQTCQRLAISLPAWQPKIVNWIKQAIIESGFASAQFSGIKVHISRGSGGRGYSAKGATQTQVTIQAFRYPEHYAQWQSEGIKVGVSLIGLGVNPLLAGLKHNNRLEQVLIKQDIEQQMVDDCIVLDCHGHIVEMCAANIFWIRQQRIFTPELKQSGVAGIQRQRVLQYAQQHSYPVEVGQFVLNDILTADEIFITNALHGVVPIVRINKTTFNVGPMTRMIQENINP